MSFWTGFTSGLAGSLDRGLQKSMNKRDEELSRAKQFWMERQASKRDKYEDEKKEQDKQAIAGYETLLVGMGGDATRAKAAFDSLVSRGGGISGVTDYLKKVRGRADQLGDYDMRPDFQDYKAGDTEYTGGTEGVRMPEFQGSRFDSSTMGLGSNPLDKLFGTSEENTDVARLQRQMDEQFGSTDRPDNAPAPSRAASFGRVDRSRLAAAESYEQEQKTIKQADAKVAREITAFGTNQQRLKALTVQIAKDEARANRGELKEYDKIKYDRNRDKLADAERKTKLEQKAEMFILEKRAKKLGITAQQLANQKAQQPPEFSDFEDMAVYATQKLAAGGLTPQQTSDFDEMKQQAIKGAKEWNAKTEADGNKKSDFSPQSVNAILDAQIKRTMGKAGLYDGVEDKVKKITEGNAESYFDNFNQAISAIEGTYGTDDEVMKNAIAQQENVLAQDVRSFIDKQLAIPAQKNKRLKIFDGSPAQLVDNAYKDNPYKKGDIIQYKEGDVTKYAIWTGRDLHTGDY